jgi:hypothetical protein
VGSTQRAQFTVAHTSSPSSTAFLKLVGGERFLRCDFFNYRKIKNHKKWESENNKKLGKGKK